MSTSLDFPINKEKFYIAFRLNVFLLRFSFNLCSLICVSVLYRVRSVLKVLSGLYLPHVEGMNGSYALAIKMLKHLFQIKNFES